MSAVKLYRTLIQTMDKGVQTNTLESIKSKPFILIFQKMKISFKVFEMQQFEYSNYSRKVSRNQQQSAKFTFYFVSCWSQEQSVYMTPLMSGLISDCSFFNLNNRGINWCCIQHFNKGGSKTRIQYNEGGWCQYFPFQALPLSCSNIRLEHRFQYPHKRYFVSLIIKISLLKIRDSSLRKLRLKWKGLLEGKSVIRPFCILLRFFTS